MSDQTDPVTGDPIAEIDLGKRRIRVSPDVRRWTGIAAFTVGSLLVLEFTIRMFMGERPNLDDEEALGRFVQSTNFAALLVIMIDLFLMTALIVLFAGFRQLITQTRPDLTWIANIGYAAGIVFVAITLVGDSMNGGAALDTVDITPEPISIRAITAGYTLMFGATGCVLSALMAGAFGYVTLLSRALPAWTGWVGLGVAAFNVLAIPTMFNGTSTANFVSAGGIAVTLLGTFPVFAWSCVVGIVTIRGRKAAPVHAPV